jgi:hypothetical protein
MQSGSMKACAFEATGVYRERHTELYNFVTPAAAALWNMRTQVAGFIAAVPDATEAQLFGRFAEGSGLRAGNLRRICVETTWEHQLDVLGELQVLAQFALYEGWLDEVLRLVGPSVSDAKAAVKAFSSAGCSQGQQKAALAMLSKHADPLATAEFQPTLRKAPHARGVADLPKLLTAMRAYKSIRNAMVHRGGFVTVDDAARISDASQLKPADLGVRATLDLPSVNAGDRVTMSFRRAVALGAVLLRVASTVDAELGGSSSSKNDVLRRLKQRFGPGRAAISSNPDSRDRRIAHALNMAGVGPAVDLSTVASWLKSEGVVWF